MVINRPFDKDLEVGSHDASRLQRHSHTPSGHTPSGHITICGWCSPFRDDHEENPEYERVLFPHYTPVTSLVRDC